MSKAPSEIPGPCLIAHPVDVHPAHREDREREKDDEYKREQIERICVALENDMYRKRLLRNRGPSLRDKPERRQKPFEYR